MRKLYLSLAALLLIGTFQLARSNPPMSVSPQIVANVTLLNNVGGVPLTTAYTPSSSGIFHVSGYAVFTNSSFGANGISITLQWVDDLQTESNIFCSNPTPGYCQGDIVIHALPGQSIQFTTGSVTVTTPYNLYLVVIKE